MHPGRIGILCCRDHERVGSALRVHQPVVEVLAVAAPLGGFIVILEPVGSDHIRQICQAQDVVLEGRGPLLLGLNQREGGRRVLISAAVLDRAHVKLADHDRMAGELVQAVQEEVGERAVVPRRAEVRRGDVGV